MKRARLAIRKIETRTRLHGATGQRRPIRLSAHRLGTTRSRLRGTRLAVLRAMTNTLLTALYWLAVGTASLLFLAWLLGVRYIPHSRVGLIEKLWSGTGSLKEGRIVATQGEAGFQADILRGG